MNFLMKKILTYTCTVAVTVCLLHWSYRACGWYMVCGIGYAVRKTKISDWYNAVRKAKKLNWYDAVRKTYTCVDTLSFIQMLIRSS